METFLGLKFPSQEGAEGDSMVAIETHAQERACGLPQHLCCPLAGPGGVPDP